MRTHVVMAGIAVLAIGWAARALGALVQVQSANGSLFYPYAAGAVSFGTKTFSSGTLLFNTDNAPPGSTGGNGSTTDNP